MKHKLTIRGNRKGYFDAGSCSCGEFNQYLTRVTRRGDIGGNRDFIKREFAKHKAEATN